MTALTVPSKCCIDSAFESKSPACVAVRALASGSSLLFSIVLVSSGDGKVGRRAFRLESSNSTSLCVCVCVLSQSFRSCAMGQTFSLIFILFYLGIQAASERPS